MVTHSPESTPTLGAFPYCPPPEVARHIAPTRAEKLTRLLNNAPRVDTAPRAVVLNYVHALQAEGVAVLPIRTGEKTPATTNGVHGATTDAATIDAMYSTGNNLGVSLGASGLVVVDADTPAEVEAWQAWQREHSVYMPTPTVSTPGTASVHNGGGHWWIDAGEAGELKDVKLGTATAMAGDRYVLLPGSVRTDVADPNQPAYVSTGRVFSPTAGSAVIEAIRTKATRTANAEKRTTTSTVGSIDAWAVQTEWDELLTPDGWTNTGEADSCGCDTYTAPGTHANPKSATAHTGQCSISNNGGALAIWTDNPPAELVDLIDAKGKRVSKFDYLTYMHHGGDTSATFTDLGLDYSTGGKTLSVSDLRSAIGDSKPPQPRGRVDLSIILADDYTPPTPKLWTRTDGAHLLYPGKSHSVHGESESGKSLLMQAVTAELISAGERVLYLDYEDTPDNVVGRLRAMGTTDDAILSMLEYWQPEPDGGNRVEPAGLADMDTNKYALVVIDGVTSALSDAGLNSNDGDDVVQWFSRVPNHLATTTGAAVVVVDHVVKNGTGGRFAVGSNQKMGQLTGAAYTVDVLTPPAQGKVGTLELSVGKDRPGGVRSFAGAPNQNRQSVVAAITVDGTKNSLTITIDPPGTANAPTVATVADGVLGALDVYLGTFTDGKKKPSGTDIIRAIVTVYGGADGMTEAEIGTVLKELAPHTGTTDMTRGTRRLKQNLKRAREKGLIKHPARGARRWVADLNTASSRQCAELISYLENEGENEPSTPRQNG